MAEIPARVQYQAPRELGEPLFVGKVRNTYGVSGHPDKLMPVATDRISIFDFVLNALVRQKGEILNAMNIFWRMEVLKDLFSHDLVAFGCWMNDYLPESLEEDFELRKRATIVRRLNMVPVEFIVRGYLTGSGWPAYQQDSAICGHKLPAGLQNGSRLPYPIFTPTNKATEGHDLHIDASGVIKEHGFGYERAVLQLYEFTRKYAAERGIILVDTKLEMGKDLYFGDELLTPDSSRFWEQAAWIKAQKDGEVPQAFDKEFVRAWGKEIGIHERDPEKPEDVVWVQSRVVPEDILAMTTKLYRYIFWRLTGKKLEEFQIYRMGIHVKIPKVNVDVIIGSRTDLEQIRVGINYLKYAPNVCPGIGNIDFRVHVLSCHRNPDELRQYAKKAAVSGKVDVIIAGAGMAAQLSGMIKAYLAAEGSDIPVIGVGFAGSTAEADQAARLSIEQLPGQPVELDSKGRAYFGGEGFCQACEAAVRDEFLPKRNAIKPAEWNIQI